MAWTHVNRLPTVPLKSRLRDDPPKGESWAAEEKLTHLGEGDIAAFHNCHAPEVRTQGGDSLPDLPEACFRWVFQKKERLWVENRPVSWAERPQKGRQ